MTTKLTREEIEYWNMRDDMVDYLDQLLDQHGREILAKLLIYEDSCDILDKKFPNHKMTDYQLEEITYEWLEK